MKKILIALSIVFLIASIFVIILVFPKDTPQFMKNYVGLNISEIEIEDVNLVYVDSEYEEGIVVSQNYLDGEIILEISNGLLDFEKYRKYSVNELGRIPVLMYHGIVDVLDSETDYTGGNVDRDGYHRTVESFERDLEFFYESGYRMIRLEDYVEGIIDVEIGLSPIILTFDDGLENNIKINGRDENGNLIIDERSAVGILENFKKKYPDFNVTATFFLNGGLFRQPQYNYDIIKWMIENGYDIGNHSLTHANLGDLSEDEAVREIGGMYKKLHEIIDDKYVNIVSLPFGIPYKKDHTNVQYIMNGNYEEFEYSTKTMLRVGWDADFSPFSTSFDKQFIKRIRAYDNNGADFDIEHVFKNLGKTRYISSGNSDIVVTISGNIDNTNTDKRIILYD